MDTTQPSEHRGRSRQPLNEVSPNDKSLLDWLIRMSINKNQFVTQAVTEPFPLTYIDVMCLVINRMIGMLLCGFWETSKYLSRAMLSRDC